MLRNSYNDHYFWKKKKKPTETEHMNSFVQATRKSPGIQVSLTKYSWSMIQTWLQLRGWEEYRIRDLRLENQKEKFRLNVLRKRESQSHP